MVSSPEDEGRVGGSKKQKAGEEGPMGSASASRKTKKAKTVSEDEYEKQAICKSAADIAAEFAKFCEETKKHISVEEMKKILEANDQNHSGSDDAVVPRCQDMMFYGPLERCPVCEDHLACTGSSYDCTGTYSEWTTCSFSKTDLPRKKQLLKIPDDNSDNKVNDWLKKDLSCFPQRTLNAGNKPPFMGMMICLSGWLTRTHRCWREAIEKHGGKVSNTVPGVTYLVVSPAEVDHGDSSKIVESMERNIPVVGEAWLEESIEKKAALPLDAYDFASHVSPDVKGIPWDRQDRSKEALSAECKLYGKRAIYMDSKLQEQGGYIFEKDGILFSCAMSICDQGKNLNEYVIMQLIILPENRLRLYYRRG